MRSVLLFAAIPLSAALLHALGHVQRAAETFDALAGSLPRAEPQPVYSRDPADPWNQAFYVLFTREIDARLMAEGAVPMPAGDDRLPVTDRHVTRIESGDRAIDPLYPAWLWMGSNAFDMSRGRLWRSLSEPYYSRLVTALAAIRASASSKPPLARALMQSDLWAAYDILHTPPEFITTHTRSSMDREQLEERRDELLRLLAESIRALALSRSEIVALPATYAAAVHAGRAPDVFDRRGGWFEVRWFPDRAHDRAVDDRRASRVFLKPVKRPPDPVQFFNQFRDHAYAMRSSIAGAVLLVQTLLVADDGTVVPSPISYDVQLRTTARAGAAARIEVVEHELSRSRLLVAGVDDGFVTFRGSDPAYLPIAGNDLSFATSTSLEQGPVLARLRDRCGVCHSVTLDHLITFSMVLAPGRPTPGVEVLDPPQDTHARDVAARKMAREDFKSLHRLWEGSAR